MSELRPLCPACGRDSIRYQEAVWMSRRGITFRYTGERWELEDYGEVEDVQDLDPDELKKPLAPLFCDHFDTKIDETDEDRPRYEIIECGWEGYYEDLHPPQEATA